ncbi:MAG: hypothetical protein ACJAUL_001681, partial [Paraglaciecola sp.]
RQSLIDPRSFSATPLSPIGHSHSATDPVIQFDTALITIGNPKVIYPAKYILTDFKELVMYRHARF